MQRLIVMGCPGSGKSTVAIRLGALTGLPVIHLDQFFWQPGWRTPEKSCWERTVGELCVAPKWIMDGNYGSTLKHRLSYADTVIYLDFPTWMCMGRVLWRTIRHHGTDRNGQLPEGCKERFDWDFFRYVQTYRKSQREVNLERLREFGGDLFVFEKPAHLSKFFAELSSEKRSSRTA